MKASPVLHQFAWLFTRADESVRLEIHERGTEFRLLINGPGSAQASHDFETMSSLMIFITSYQNELKNNEYKLQASAERRGSVRGGNGPSGEDRRRDAKRSERP
jgi:hypothetical protein